MTEVRPGCGRRDCPPATQQEEYITSGFLRSSNRTLTSASTALDPVPTYLAADKKNLPAGKFTLVRIPVDPIAHTFRAGTGLRIVISAPGGDRPSWTFQTPATHNEVVDTVALGGSRRILLGGERGGRGVPAHGPPGLRGPAGGALPDLRPDSGTRPEVRW